MTKSSSTSTSTAAPVKPKETAEERAAACVQAFEGCPSPKAFKEAIIRVKVLDRLMSEAARDSSKGDAGALSDEMSAILQGRAFAWLPKD